MKFRPFHPFSENYAPFTHFSRKISFSSSLFLRKFLPLHPFSLKIPPPFHPFSVKIPHHFNPFFHENSAPFIHAYKKIPPPFIHFSMKNPPPPFIHFSVKISLSSSLFPWKFLPRHPFFYENSAHFIHSL